jgi:hypothetical protein
MKPLGLPLLAVLMSLPALTFAGSQAPKPEVPESEAGKSFDSLKSLAGEWEGRVTLVPDMPQMSDGNSLYHVSLRVTSRGHAIVHEMQEAGTPMDPGRYDHPVTMLYLDGGRLTLVHYCDAGNRPRMVGKVSPDGKTVEFELVDISGGTQHGHMDHAVFTAVDTGHHTEDWTYVLPGDKTVHARFDLRRVSPEARASW